MKNPKTTIVGYLLLLAAVVQVVVGLLSGTVDTISIQHVIEAVTGLGLIGASDGGV